MKGAPKGSPDGSHHNALGLGVGGVENRTGGSGGGHELGLDEGGMNDDDDPDI